MDPVAQSSNQAAVFLQRSELDEFLFAPVIDDGTGMTLSVLSMLARAGVDPRGKAAELARLPEGKAIDALTSLIDELPRDLMPRGEAEAVAARLTALLPRRTNPASTNGQAKIGAPLTQTHAVAIAAILVFFLVGAVWATAGRQSLAQAGGPVRAASAAVAAPTPLARAVR